MGLALMQRGIELTDFQLDRLMAVGDTDGDSLLNVDEFVNFCTIVSQINFKVEKSGLKFNQVNIKAAQNLKGANAGEEHVLKVCGINHDFSADIFMVENEHGEMENQDRGLRSKMEDEKKNSNLVNINASSFIATTSKNMRDRKTELSAIKQVDLTFDYSENPKHRGASSFLGELIAKKESLKKVVTIFPTDESKKIDSQRIRTWEKFQSGLQVMGIKMYQSDIHDLDEDQTIIMTEKVEKQIKEEESKQEGEESKLIVDGDRKLSVSSGKMLGRGKFGMVISGTVGANKAALKVPITVDNLTNNSHSNSTRVFIVYLNHYRISQLGGTI